MTRRFLRSHARRCIARDSKFTAKIPREQFVGSETKVMNAFAQLRCSSEKNARAHGPIANRKPSLIYTVRNHGCLFATKSKVRNRVFAHGLRRTEDVICAVEEWTLAEHLLSNVIVVGQVRFPTRKLATLV